MAKLFIYKQIAYSNRSIFSKPKEGYDLLDHYGGKGFWVSPIDMNRDKLYSERAHLNFDFPAFFKAKIQAKYLENTGKYYEAWLRSENVKHLREIEIGEFPSKTSLPCYRELDSKKYSPQLIRRYNQAAVRHMSRDFFICETPFKELNIEYLFPKYPPKPALGEEMTIILNPKQMSYQSPKMNVVFELFINAMSSIASFLLRFFKRQ